MLTLTSIQQRIDELEQAEYSTENEKLDTWLAMVAIAFGAKDTRVSPWWQWTFSDLLPPNDNFGLEKLDIAFNVVVDIAINELGYSQLQLENALNEVEELVAKLLADAELWQSFYQSKRDESERHELQLRYRRDIYNGVLSQDGIEWLQQNDKDFWQNYVAKNDSNLSNRTEHTHTTPPSLAQVENLPEVETTIEVIYTGLDPQGSFSVECVGGIIPVWRYRVYTVTEATWQNIKTDTRWKKVTTNG